MSLTGKLLQYTKPPFVVALHHKEPGVSGESRRRGPRDEISGVEPAGRLFEYAVATTHRQQNSRIPSGSTLYAACDPQFGFCRAFRCSITRPPPMRTADDEYLYSRSYFSTQLSEGVDAAFQSIKPGGIWFSAGLGKTTSTIHVTFLRRLDQRRRCWSASAGDQEIEISPFVFPFPPRLGAH